jgi:hypothetical protein
MSLLSTSATVQENSPGRIVIFDHLRNVFDAENVKSTAQKKSVNRSLVLRVISITKIIPFQAVTALRMVPEGVYFSRMHSLDWDGWMCKPGSGKLYHNRRNACLKSKKTIIKSEGKLIQAYGLYPAAEFETALNNSP